MSRRFRISLLAAVALLAGCSDSSGPDGLTILGCKQGKSYTIGSTVNGSISSSDCSDPDGASRADYYQFRQASTGPVSITLTVPANSVTLIVGLVDSNEDLIDFGIVQPGESVVIGGNLPAGTYYIIVGTGEPGARGNYALSSNRTLPPADPPFFNCATSQPYTIGTTVNGSLANGDCVTPDGSYMDRHQFTLGSARTVTIDLTSDIIDAYLYLFDGAGVVIAQDDDSGGAFNSRITISLQAGTYSIGASSFDLETGGYTLRTQ